MRKKSLFYLTSTAILIAASSHQVFAAESVKASTSETTVELNKQEADSSPKFKTKEATHTSPVNQVTSSSSSENEVTDSSTALTEAKASKEKSVVKENPVVANETKKDNKSTFFAAQNNQATARSNTDAQVKKSTFVDVSSHNGYISKEDYQRLAEKGVSGAVVKLTEGTSYKNPYAISQAQNAQAAGMQVSAYAFSHYTNEAEARAEARYFAEEARRLNLPSSTVMVNDIEDSDMLSNINTSTQAWADEMRRMGFSNLMYYTSASWLDRNNLRTKGPIQTERFGLENFWVAQYPTSKLSADDAKTLKYNSEAGAWQFTSQAELLPGRHVFDQSVDYTGRFTGNAPIAKNALSGTITIANNNPETGTFDVIVSGVSSPYGVREVKVPTWSSINGQDDIIWYTATKQANGTYKVTVKASDHKRSVGEYNIHLYYIQNNGKLVGVTGTKTNVSIAKPQGKITIKNNNPDTGTFDVIVSGVSSPYGVREVKLPTWSNVNGQDDIIWYTATKQANGTYKVTVRASDHKYSTGIYNVHLYYIQDNGQIVGVAGTQTVVSLAKPQGQITIQNNNPDTGTFDVIVSGVSSPYGVREVKLPTWSSVNGQDDIIWYTATKQANGTYKVTVKASDHKYSTGLYYVHLYYVQNNGTLIGVGGTSTNVTISPEKLKPTGKITIQKNNPNTGTFEVVVSNVFSPNGVREVKLPTWSSVNGQDDVSWYTAAKQADGTYKLFVNVSNHKNSTGEYNVHLYYVQNDGQLVGVGGIKLQVNKRVYETPYYSQRDSRWAGRTYGGYTFAATGCVPTTVAMAISGITGQTVLPTTVADYLYHSTNEFNKRSYGTTSHGIVLAARHWGLKTETLGSTAAVREALAMGHHVLGAVGTSVFANYPVTHELIMKGYNNGMTYVMDPYNASNNGYYSVDYLFRVRSLAPTDNTEGSPFMTIRA
ncbi:GBS Bsp-like repeat-containing protein [Streptococcus constellatus subsp. viborgensis]|uniref:GBS Bsp-like repeat-containing protein n=1 Tax=Streptococcus constellatus TaxID=76860 RepID=UPI0018E1CDC5|nr:GBS Bsp-like repeat-containing protein [Streptococcus constellatus]QQC22990.1 GBS Bsp-like repeat-containing protein [Streptococcus constellatus]